MHREIDLFHLVGVYREHQSLFCGLAIIDPLALTYYVIFRWFDHHPIDAALSAVQAIYLQRLCSVKISLLRPRSHQLGMLERDIHGVVERITVSIDKRKLE